MDFGILTSDFGLQISDLRTCCQEWPYIWFISKYFQASEMLYCSTFNFLLILGTNVVRGHFQPLVLVGNLCRETDVAFIVFDCVTHAS